MRCPECTHNQKYRSGMKCARCGYQFVLSPKQAPYAADRRFVRAIAVVSKDGERAYTSRQLHATMFRRRNRGWWHRLFLARGTSDVRSTEAAVATWERAQRPLGPIIARPALESSGAPEWPEPDVYDYGAEGILVVDDRLLVDLLVALGLHTVARVVIVEAAHAYPRQVVERLPDLVGARPDLPVFVLHASPLGTDEAEAMIRSARDLLGAATNPVIDLGLRADAPTRLAPLRWARRLPSSTPDMLPYRWLTSGLAAAIAQRVSLDELVHPPTGAEPGDTVPISIWSAGDHDDGHDAGDGDFG